FLDEICNISDAMQMKLLRILQEQQVTRVGGVTPQPIDVRFVAATNRDLASMVDAGEFRHDLYHRLNVVGIEMPPLRERTEDIPALTHHFVQEVAAQYDREVEGFTAEALSRLASRPWPGNLRELRNLVERCVVLADSPWVAPTLVDQLLEQSEGGGLPANGLSGRDAPPEGRDPESSSMASLEEVERLHILRVLEAVEGHRERAARILGINKTTLWRKLKHYKLTGVSGEEAHG
ncbi:MAG TPA: sigma 54-interacting transcriptional regulator, partial [Gammaproteobacteria bacterium]|nr:sigma 54-interacting transcriptional regulator [Gammaproteobacteria bacterium]